MFFKKHLLIFTEFHNEFNTVPPPPPPITLNSTYHPVYLITHFTTHTLSKLNHETFDICFSLNI